MADCHLEVIITLWSRRRRKSTTLGVKCLMFLSRKVLRSTMMSSPCTQAWQACRHQLSFSAAFWIQAVLERVWKTVWIFAPKTCWQSAVSLTQKWSIRGPVRTSTADQLKETEGGNGVGSSSSGRSTAVLFPSTSHVFRAFSNNQSILVFSRKASKVAAARRSLPQTRTCCSCEKPCRCGGANKPKIYCFHPGVKVSTLFFSEDSTNIKECKNTTLISKDSRKGNIPWKTQMVLEWFPSCTLLNIYMDGREWKLNLLSILKTPTNGFLPHL